MIYITCPAWAPSEYSDAFRSTPDFLVICAKCKRPICGYSAYRPDLFGVHPDPEWVDFHHSKLTALRHILQLTIRHHRRECWA